jgi:hypothetical protein
MPDLTKDTPEEREPRTLHIGVDVTHLNAVTRSSHPIRWVIDGDGWEVWGESVGDDNNDATTLHLISAEAVGDVAARQIVTDLLEHLVPMLRNTEPGTVAVLTDVSDWSEDVATLTYVPQLSLNEKRVLRYYTSADEPGDQSPWSVYSERYERAEDAEPIEGSWRYISRHPSQAEADAEANRLGQEQQR